MLKVTLKHIDAFFVSISIIASSCSQSSYINNVKDEYKSIYDKLINLENSVNNNPRGNHLDSFVELEQNFQQKKAKVLGTQSIGAAYKENNYSVRFMYLFYDVEDYIKAMSYAKRVFDDKKITEEEIKAKAHTVYADCCRKLEIFDDANENYNIAKNKLQAQNRAGLSKIMHNQALLYLAQAASSDSEVSKKLYLNKAYELLAPKWLDSYVYTQCMRANILFMQGRYSDAADRLEIVISLLKESQYYKNLQESYHLTVSESINAFVGKFKDLVRNGELNDSNKDLVNQCIEKLSNGLKGEENINDIELSLDARLISRISKLTGAKKIFYDSFINSILNSYVISTRISSRKVDNIDRLAPIRSFIPIIGYETSNVLILRLRDRIDQCNDIVEKSNRFCGFAQNKLHLLRVVSKAAEQFVNSDLFNNELCGKLINHFKFKCVHLKRDTDLWMNNENNLNQKAGLSLATISTIKFLERNNILDNMEGDDLEKQKEFNIINFKSKFLYDTLVSVIENVANLAERGLVELPEDIHIPLLREKQERGDGINEKKNFCEKCCCNVM